MSNRRGSAQGRQALLVLGMHRSGTSSVAGTLARLGAVPPRTLMPPTTDNPRGYYESIETMALNDRILSLAGSRWDDWDAFNPSWKDSLAGHEVTEEIPALLEREYAKASLILIKDPRICRFADIWIQALGGMSIVPKVVCLYRHPLDVARSLERRDGTGRPRALLMWLRNVLDAEFASRSTTRAFVDYDVFLGDWRACVTALSATLDVPWPRWSNAVEADIDLFVTDVLRHGRGAGPDAFKRFGEVGEWAQATYRALQRLSAKPDAREACLELDVIRAAFNRSVQLYGPVAREQEAAGEQRGRIEIEQRESERMGDALNQVPELRDLLARQLAATTERDDAIASLQAENENAQQTFQQTFALLQAENEEAQRTFQQTFELLQAQNDEAARGFEQTIASLREELQHQLQANESLLRQKDEDSRQLGQSIAALSAELTSQQDAGALLLRQTTDSLRSELETQQLANASLINQLDQRFVETGTLTRLLLDAERMVAEKEAALGASAAKASRDQAALQAKLTELQAKLIELQRKLTELQAALQAARNEQARSIATLKQSFQDQLARLLPNLDPAKRDAQPVLDAKLVHSLGSPALADLDRAIARLQAQRQQEASRIDALAGDIHRQQALLRKQHAELSSILHSRPWRMTHPLRLAASALGRDFVDPSCTQAELLRVSELFDPVWYVSTYQDVANSGVDPAVHYLEFGAAEGRDPGPAFSTSEYRSRHPELADGVNPLLHFLGNTGDPVRTGRR